MGAVRPVRRRRFARRLRDFALHECARGGRPVTRISGDDGSSLLGQVVSQFAATSAPLLQTLRAKSRDSDPQAVWRAAHSLRSSASAIGARRVSQYCEEIEMSARDNGILPAEALLAELESEVAAATVDLSALVRAEQGAA